MVGRSVPWLLREAAEKTCAQVRAVGGACFAALGGSQDWGLHILVRRWAHGWELSVMQRRGGERGRCYVIR